MYVFDRWGEVYIDNATGQQRPLSFPISCQTCAATKSSAKERNSFSKPQQHLVKLVEYAF